ncbi:MAG TPA: ferritin-like domain-containing protein [Acidimicrobiales bacterium]|nr:ferritin-like domain-containing protein [Acidimicrobiales bacterium]
MAGSSAELHEDPRLLRPGTVERHRAIVSVMEELEAIDWYDQRVDASGDPDLAAVLAHNRDEEKEHAMMTLEWLRRHDPALDQHMRTYLFTSGPITAIEAAAVGEAGAPSGSLAGEASPQGSLGIGSLRGSGL